MINAILMESKVGQFPTDADGKPLGLLDPSIATSKDNSLDTYRKIFKKGGGGRGGKKFDEHLPPGVSMGKDPTQATNERNQAEWDTEVASAISVAKAMGKLPMELQRALEAVLEPKLTGVKRYSLYLPVKLAVVLSTGGDLIDGLSRATSMLRAGRVLELALLLLGIDTSGSIGKLELDMFMAEMAGILEDVDRNDL